MYISRLAIRGSAGNAKSKVAKWRLALCSWLPGINLLACAAPCPTEKLYSDAATASCTLMVIAECSSGIMQGLPFRFSEPCFYSNA